MKDDDLKDYWIRVTQGRTAEAKAIHPGNVVTAPWVRLKCQFGCARYGKSYCCPPDTPTPEQMKQVLGSYQRAVLFHLQSAKESGQSLKTSFTDFRNALVDLEGEMFRDGYYKVLVLLAGPCRICERCAKGSGEPCTARHRARPSMEACGVDVYATARGNGFPIQPLRERGETQNNYCLMLVD